MSDTSILVALHFLGRMELLEKFYRHVLIPPAVQAEFLQKSTDADTALRQPWLECRQPLDAARVAELREALDRGEAEALALAEEVNADLVLIDEREARAVATRLGFSLIGVVGILARARRERLIEGLKPDFDRLRKGLNFYLDESLYRRVLELAGEDI